MNGEIIVTETLDPVYRSHVIAPIVEQEPAYPNPFAEGTCPSGEVQIETAGRCFLCSQCMKKEEKVAAIDTATIIIVIVALAILALVVMVALRQEKKHVREIKTLREDLRILQEYNQDERNMIQKQIGNFRDDLRSKFTNQGNGTGTRDFDKEVRRRIVSADDTSIRNVVAANSSVAVRKISYRRERIKERRGHRQRQEKVVDCYRVPYNLLP